MLPGKISKRVVSDRLGWVDQMLAEIRNLPLDSRQVFMQDRRNIWSAESCLRRALEALFDVSRHIAAKGFGKGVTEYKEIATVLHKSNVISKEDLHLMQKLAGYRNRLVHFYHDVNPDELFDICTLHLGDIERMANSLRTWIAQHQNSLDDSL